MAFTSTVFLVRFLPAALLFYYICPSRMRNWLLIIFSILFYAWNGIISLAVLLAVAVLGYFSAWAISASEGKKKKTFLVLSLICIIGCLVAFRYTRPFTEFLSQSGVPVPRIDLPAVAGISFFTFTIIGYLIDVYSGRSEVCLIVSDYLLFVLLFPKLIMGPIVRIKDLSEGLSNRAVTSEDLEEGALLFVKGLAKKAILADSISSLWSDVNEIGFSASSGFLCWTAVAAFSFQLYFDFSGYSDMALGLGRFFGFKLPENFRTPYSSVSVTEFWRRWHITMSQWFRDYIYIPLGGNRCSPLRNALNLLIVWLLTGLWHGFSLNFVLWGLYYFLILLLERIILHKFLENNRLIGHIYTFFVTFLGWTLFAVNDTGKLITLFSRLFMGTGGISAIYYLRNYGVLLVLCLFLCTDQAADLWKRLSDRRSSRTAITLILLALSIAYIIGSTYHPFLYAQF